MLNFLKYFYMSVYENMKGTLSRTKKKGLSFGAKCDLNVFWRTILDESEATKKEKDAAINALVHLINEIPYLDKEKVSFFKQCVVNLRENTSLFTSLEYIEKIVKASIKS